LSSDENRRGDHFRFLSLSRLPQKRPNVARISASVMVSGTARSWLGFPHLALFFAHAGLYAERQHLKPANPEGLLSRRG
jgi:hypothetical protein